MMMVVVVMVLVLVMMIENIYNCTTSLLCVSQKAVCLRKLCVSESCVSQKAACLRKLSVSEICVSQKAVYKPDYSRRLQSFFTSKERQ